MVIPYSPVAGLLGLDGPAPALLALLVLITVLYVAATEVTKYFFYRRLGFGHVDHQ